MIQLRDKGLDDRELIVRAKLLVEMAREQTRLCLNREGEAPAEPAIDTGSWLGGSLALPKIGIPPAEPGAGGRALGSTLAIINDRADVAAIVGADGVHLGQDDLSVKDARAIVGPRMLVGASTHNHEQARQAVLDGANYLGAGPTFPSQTKAFDDFVGLDYLRQAAAEIRLPMFAIGGIHVDNLPDVLAAGISRVAVGAAVTSARDPGFAARKLLVMLENTHAQSPAPSGY
jgi:thiamine-phosphate diphosphorylase